MKNFIVNQIGTVKSEKGNFSVELDKKYIPALTGIEDFAYVNVVWWASRHDNKDDRENLIEKSPYKNYPELLGVFATRSPQRPNPIAITTCAITHIDTNKGIISFDYIDAENGTPVLDIKPYHPSSDKVENPIMPSWCKDFPKNIEESEHFDWSTIFNF